MIGRTTISPLLLSVAALAIACAPAAPDRPAPEPPREGAAAALADADTLRTRALAQDLQLVYAWYAEGPWAIWVLDVALGECAPRLEARKAGPPLSTRRPAAILAGPPAIAGVNADFFEEDGTPTGAHVEGGEVLRGPGDWPVFALGEAGPWIGRAGLAGRVIRRADTLRVEQVNRDPLAAEATIPAEDGLGTPGEPAGAEAPVEVRTVPLTLFTHWAGAAAPEGFAVSVAVRRLTGTPASGSGVVIQVDTTGASLPVRPGTVVFASGAPGPDLRAWAQDDTVAWHVALIRDPEAAAPVEGAAATRSPEPAPADPVGAGGGEPGSRRFGSAAGAREAVGGFPVLVRGGEVAPDIGEARTAFAALHPRTAVGIADGGERLLLVAVDGRQPDRSEGMTLEELAELMIRLGAEEALNLDGGGSTTLVVHGQVANRPSDATGERPVANVLALVPGPCPERRE